MKKIRKNFVVIWCTTMAMVVGMFVSCASSKVEQKADVNTNKQNNVSTEADNAVIADWQDRGMGMKAQPEWLRDMLDGKKSAAKALREIDSDRIVKIARATSSTELRAQTIARTQFVYALAAELRQTVAAELGAGLDDRTGEAEAVWIAAAAINNIQISGAREESSHWVKMRTKNPETGKVQEEYTYYILYSMPKDAWEEYVRSYILSLLPKIEGEETRQKIGALYSKIVADEDKKSAEQAANDRAMAEAIKARAEADSKMTERKTADQSSVDRAFELEKYLK